MPLRPCSRETQPVNGTTELAREAAEARRRHASEREHACLLLPVQPRDRVTAAVSGSSGCSTQRSSLHSHTTVI